MKTRVASVLGLAMLAASFAFGSSFACFEAAETTASALQAVAPESEAIITEPQTGITEAQIVEVDQPAAVIGAIEPSPTEVSPPPAIRFVDAIVAEITQTVTIAVPGQTEDNEEAVLATGSIPLSHDDEPILVRDLTMAPEDAN